MTHGEVERDEVKEIDNARREDCPVPEKAEGDDREFGAPDLPVDERREGNEATYDHHRRNRGILPCSRCILRE